VQQDFRKSFIQIPGVITSIEEVNESGQSQKPLQVNLRGTDIVRLKAYASELRDKMYAIRGIRDMKSAWSTTSPNTGLSWNARRRRAPG